MLHDLGQSTAAMLSVSVEHCEGCREVNPLVMLMHCVPLVTGSGSLNIMACKTF